MVSDFKNKSILIVGLGLMGGSIAKALQDKDIGALYAVDKDENVLSCAKKSGIIDDGFIDAKEVIEKCDIVMVCLYPELAVEFINDNMSHFKSGAIVSDICGVKKPIVDGIISNLRQDIDFVPAHPMAGSERQGYECSFASLFEGCHYIITPLSSNSQKSLDLVSDFAMMLGAKNIVIAQPYLHDEYIAYTSQIPHALAIAYMHTSNEREILPYSGGSFRDVSRVAHINEVMWTELFNQNNKPLISELKKLQQNLGEITRLIEEKDTKALQEYMRKGAMIKENYDASIDD